MIPSWQSRNFAWSGCNRDVREAFLCIRFVEPGRSIWHLFQTDFTEIMLLFWDVFLLFHTFFRLYNAGQMFFGGASSKKNHSWRLKREFYGTQCQQAVRAGTNSRFLNRIFWNPNSKCLLGCAQTPFVLHRADAGGAFVPNAFITKRRDRPEFFSKEGLWSVVVYWDFVFGAALFVCAARPHGWTGEQLFCHQSHKEKCREKYNLFQHRHYIKYEPYALL